jgi:hypothetical protein
MRDPTTSSTSTEYGSGAMIAFCSDAEFLDSEFGSKRYRISAFERGTWLDVVASALMLQLHEEGDAIRH